MELPNTFALLYFIPRYLLSAVCFWLAIHYWVNGRFYAGSYKYYDMRPWMARRPWPMMALSFVLASVFLVLMNNYTKPEYAEPYFNLLAFAAPVLYTWYVLGIIVVSALISVYFYRQKEMRYGGALSFVAVMLTALVAPYYALYI